MQELWKRKVRIFMAVLFLLTVVGCSSYRLVGSWETKTSKGWSMKYSFFDGEKYCTVKLKEPTDIRVQVTSQKGTLHLEIGESGKEPIYSGNLTEDFSFTVHAEPGTYTIRAEGEKHGGSFRIDWGE